MKFFAKALEYNKLAKAFNGHYQMLSRVIAKSSDEDIKDDILILAYLSRREIIDRIETYQWNMNTKIIVPMMPGDKKTLAYAFEHTIGKLLQIADQEGCYNQVMQILDKKDIYYKLDDSLPGFLKNML